MLVMMMIIIIITLIMMLAHGWRPLRGGERAQRDTAFKLVVIHIEEIQNWGRC